MSELTTSIEQQHPLVTEMLKQERPTTKLLQSAPGIVTNKQITVKEESVVCPPDEWPLEPCEKEFDLSPDEERECIPSTAKNTTNHEKKLSQKAGVKAPPVVSIQTPDGSVVYYEQTSQHRKQLKRKAVEIAILKRKIKRLKDGKPIAGSAVDTDKYADIIHEIQILGEEHQSELLSIKTALETHIARYKTVHNSYMQAVNNVLISHQFEDSASSVSAEPPTLESSDISANAEPIIVNTKVATSTSNEATAKDLNASSDEPLASPLDNDVDNDLDFLLPKQSRLTKTERNPLESWFKKNYTTGLYPSRKELLTLSIQSGLGIRKVRNWFVNARYRAKIRLQGTKNVPYWITKIKYDDESNKSNAKTV